MTTTNCFGHNYAATRIAGSIQVTKDGELTATLNGKAAGRAKFIPVAFNGEVNVVVGCRQSPMGNWYGCPVVNVPVQEG